MRRLGLLLAISFVALSARGDGFSGQAQLSYQQYDYGITSTAGFRQIYDLRLDRAFSSMSLLRLYFRGDDFRGDRAVEGLSQRNDSRLLQPMAEFQLNLGNLRAMARSDYFDTRSSIDGRDSVRTLQRTMGQLFWDPEGLPRVTIIAQRNATNDGGGGVRLTDDNINALAQYDWKGFTIAANERYARSTDPASNYDRSTTTHQGNLGYTQSIANGKLMVSAQANAQLSNLDERTIDGGSASVPSPVSINKASYAVDETPLDDRDVQPAPLPALIDGNINAVTTVSLGPDAVSFQNIVLDLARVDRADEVRIIVRDAAGNPLRNGGGPVTWDVYVSADGHIWTPVSGAQTTWSAPLSLYSVTFNQTTSRWFKVVSFGVNSEATLVTEVQAYYHTTVNAGTARKGTQSNYTATATFTVHPVERLTFTYTGLYNGLDQDLVGRPSLSTRDLEHMGSIQLQVAKTLGLRGEYLTRSLDSFAGRADTADSMTGFIDYTPTRQLRLTTELGTQRQLLNGSDFTIDTEALHVYAQVLRSLGITFNAGVQTQTFAADGSSAERQYVDLTGNAQLFPALRLLLTSTLQRTTSNSDDPATQLLGPQRDNRVTGDFIWRAGRPLSVGVRVGWVDGQTLSGFTQRYHVDWYPFADGSVSIGGSYDQDIDPMLGRRATRVIFNPRWVMNRFVIIDVNYTSVSTSLTSTDMRQRTLFATVTLIR